MRKPERTKNKSTPDQPIANKLMKEWRLDTGTAHEVVKQYQQNGQAAQAVKFGNTGLGLLGDQNSSLRGCGRSHDRAQANTGEQ